jgi:2-polyprenyl-6-methoxyphenol hydroxylase-like FAD-dependent oxidoreductase
MNPSVSEAKAESQISPEPEKVDIVIIGAGFAGAVLALKLGRMGYRPLVIDPEDPSPTDFRCEKFSPSQASTLQALGVARAFVCADTVEREAEQLTSVGLRYDAMVNALRRAWPQTVTLLRDKVRDLKPGAARQIVELASGRVLSPRLTIVATGPSMRLISELGLERRTLTLDHTVTLGFDLKAPPQGFGFESLVHAGERPGDGFNFISLFPLGDHMRANLFVHLDPRSAPVQQLRADPLAALARFMPKLAPRLSGVELASAVEMRVTDLYELQTAALDGIVLIGDARRNSCPATGTGLDRVLGDVRLLTRTCIPIWLSVGRIEADDIRLFYDDLGLRTLDQEIARKDRAGRKAALSTAIGWRVRRLVRRGAPLLRAMARGRRRAA